MLGLLAAVSAGHGYVEVHSRLLENCDATLDVKVRRAAAYTLASLDEEAQTISAELVARFRTEDDAAAEVGRPGAPCTRRGMSGNRRKG